MDSTELLELLACTIYIAIRAAYCNPEKSSNFKNPAGGSEMIPKIRRSPGKSEDMATLDMICNWKELKNIFACLFVILTKNCCSYKYSVHVTTRYD